MDCPLRRSGWRSGNGHTATPCSLRYRRASAEPAASIQQVHVACETKRVVAFWQAAPRGCWCARFAPVSCGPTRRGTRPWCVRTAGRARASVGLGVFAAAALCRLAHWSSDARLWAIDSAGPLHAAGHRRTRRGDRESGEHHEPWQFVPRRFSPSSTDLAEGAAGGPRCNPRWAGGCRPKHARRPGVQAGRSLAAHRTAPTTCPASQAVAGRRPAMAPQRAASRPPPPPPAPCRAAPAVWTPTRPVQQMAMLSLPSAGEHRRHRTCA